MNILLFMLVGVVLFVIGREVICWYFKINKIVALLERIEENTRPKSLIRESLEKSENLI